MSLVFDLKRVKKNDIEEARKELGDRYTGPTPPPDVYDVTVKKVFAVEQSNGPALNVLMLVNGTGETSEYDGAPIWNRFTIPSDPSAQYFGVQVNVLDSFLRGVSKNKFTFDDFVSASNEGRIQAGKSSNSGQEIVQIGKLKFPNETKFAIKTKLNEYNGRTSAVLHYVLDVPSEPVDDVDLDDVDVDNSLSEDSDELDELLGDI